MPESTPARPEQEQEQPKTAAGAQEGGARMAPAPLGPASMAGSAPPPDPGGSPLRSDSLAPVLRQAVLARSPVDDLWAIGNEILDKAQAAGNQVVDSVQGQANGVIDQVQQAVTNVLGDNEVTQVANQIVDKAQGAGNQVVDTVQGNANAIIDKGQQGAANIGAGAGILSTPGGGSTNAKDKSKGSGAGIFTTSGGGSTDTKDKTKLSGVGQGGAAAIANAGATQGKPPGAAPMIKQGSSGTWVAHAQNRLNAHGLYGLAPDGLFGPLTKAATVSHQGMYGLGADGIIGPKTWKSLDAPTMFGGDSYLPPSEQIGAGVQAIGAKDKLGSAAGAITGKG